MNDQTPWRPSPQVRIGLELCCQRPPAALRKAHFGLLMNQASVDARFQYAHELLAKQFPSHLKAIFAPQHGLWSEQQDNMIETPHSRLSWPAVPVHSLYCETRRPSDDMLSGLDLLVIDLQDVGTRVYTFIWTISHCLEACAEADIPILILDRPNPLGGQVIEGPRLNLRWRSFVGRAPLPMRHALTVAELTLAVNELLGIGANIQVVRMQHWMRSMDWPRTGRTWVPTSPNLPRWEGVQVYPGQVLLEGTNLSEGRGTTTPFELFGAPFIDPQLLLRELEQCDLPGVRLRPLYFVPTFQKHAGVRCGGLFLHVTDPVAFRAYETTASLLLAVRRQWPDRLQWNPPPYEYEFKHLPIDILAGDSALRETIDAQPSWESGKLLTAVRCDDAAWWDAVDRHLLYDDSVLPQETP